MRRHGEGQLEPPGGRAAERLREFLAARFGEDVELPPGAAPGPADESREPTEESRSDPGGERSDAPPDRRRRQTPPGA